MGFKGVKIIEVYFRDEDGRDLHVWMHSLIWACVVWKLYKGSFVHCTSYGSKHAYLKSTFTLESETDGNSIQNK